MTEFKLIDLEGAKEFGGGKFSTTYYSTDGNWVIKLYGPRYSAANIVAERDFARAVQALGLPTPGAGDLIRTDDGRHGLLLERINPKISVARAIADEPDRVEELSRRFARICKQIHSTPCDTEAFSPYSDVLREGVLRSQVISDDVRSAALARLDATPAATTCTHGDLHSGNVLLSGDRSVIIDIGDFEYGNPLLDQGMFYFVSHLIPEEEIQDMYHMPRSLAVKSWRWYAAEYSGAQTEAEVDEFERMVQPYAALRAIWISSHLGRIPNKEAVELVFATL